MADRYFVDEPIAGAAARLSGSEAHHLAHVMRARPGVEVTLFDGSGAEFLARVEHVGRAEIELAILERQAIDRELQTSIVLGVALPKGDRQRWLVEKATELGAARVVPLATARSNDRESPAAIEKLRRAVVEASKQCGRNRLMEIAPPEPVADFLQTPADESTLRLFAHPGGLSQRVVLDATFRSDAPPRSIVAAIGPEGGFTGEEATLAGSHGWQAIDLGRTILRVETAALAVVSAITSRLDAS
jgi:16S rRNA (uracil1498-N3)-methyltransferase